MQIVEIIDRSEQGITRPFLCRGEDDALYYVKGYYAGYRSLCCEWVASELARRLGLPVAPFAIVEVPPALIQGSLRSDAVDLGAGMAFGSREVPNTTELRWNEVESDAIPDDLRARILLFDWWISNPDRVLGPVGGNANLLWSAFEQQLHVIDHNLAFSRERMSPSLHEFCDDHIFGADLLVREVAFLIEEAAPVSPLTLVWGQLQQFWQENPTMLNEIWSEMPDEWTESAPDFTLQSVRALLSRVEDDDFWGINEAGDRMHDD